MSKGGRLGLGLLSLYVLLVLLPLALAALQLREARPWRSELATGLAMAGFTMLLVEFVLSGRWRWLSRHVGMDAVMRFHQFMGQVLLLFLLLHPFLYNLPMNVRSYGDLDGATWLSLPLAAGLTGLLAWMGLGLLVFFAVARDALPYRYETWRFWHGFGALLIALFSLHHVLAAGRYSQQDVLGAFWVIAVALAMLALAHVHLFTPLRARRRPFRVAKVERVADRTWCLALEPDREGGHDGRPLSYEAGQFAWLKIGGPLGRITEHPFSISSSPDQWPRVEFTIKEAGDFTACLERIEPGTRAYLDGPYGDFVLEDSGRPLVMIAGGVGMAPMMSLLRRLRAQGSERRIILLQANRYLGQILFRDELAAMERELALTVHYTLRQPPEGWRGLSGVPRVDLLKTVVPEVLRERAMVYVCGPQPMIEDVEAALVRDLDIPVSRIMSEQFKYNFGARSGNAGQAVRAFSVATLVILAGVLLFAVR